MKMIDDRCFGECMGKIICCIYMIMRISTGQKYIGQTIDLNHRNYQHSMGFDSSNCAIDADIKKYGWDDFFVQILEIVPKNQNLLDERERFWIKYYNTYKDPYHYNLTPGGKSCGWGKDHPAFKGTYRIVLGQIDPKGQQRYKLVNPESEVIKTSVNLTQLKQWRNDLENGIITDEYVKSFHRIKIRDNIDDVINMYQNGSSLKSISEKYDCQYQTVSKILKENNIETNRKSKVWNHEKEVCDMYQNGKTIREIAIYFSCSNRPIRNILIKNNIEVSKKSKAWYHEKEVCDMYKNGMSMTRIAQYFSCEGKVIKQILKQNNIEKRSKSEEQFIDRPYIWEHQKEICDMYKQGKTQREIADYFLCGINIIRRVLYDNNIKIDKKSKKSDVWNYQKEICNMYKQGKTITEVAQYYSCSHSTIKRILKHNNIKKNVYHKSDAWNYEKEICKIYQTTNLSTNDLGKKFECTTSTICDILTKNNIKIQKRYKSKKSKAWDFASDICKIYQTTNVSTYDLGEKFKCSNKTIERILRANNIPRKDKLFKIHS